MLVLQNSSASFHSPLLDLNLSGNIKSLCRQVFPRFLFIYFEILMPFQKLQKCLMALEKWFGQFIKGHCTVHLKGVVHSFSAKKVNFIEENKIDKDLYIFYACNFSLLWLVSQNRCLLVIENEFYQSNNLCTYYSQNTRSNTYIFIWPLHYHKIVYCCPLK